MMNRKIRKPAIHTLLWVFILILLVGCNPKGNPLASTSWNLLYLNGENLIGGTAIKLDFSDEYLGGTTGCNLYGGSADGGGYRTAGEGAFSLKFPFAVTVQLCSEPKGIMVQEEAYLEALKEAASYRIVDDRLEISNQAGETILVYQKK
jgi:heat shock protein HslJ